MINNIKRLSSNVLFILITVLPAAFAGNVSMLNNLKNTETSQYDTALQHDLSNPNSDSVLSAVVNTTQIIEQVAMSDSVPIMIDQNQPLSLDPSAQPDSSNVPKLDIEQSTHSNTLVNNLTYTEKNRNLAMWNWKATTWNNSPNQFITKIKSKGINQIYLQLFIENQQIEYEEQLINLLDIAFQNGIEIIAVEGAAEMILESGLQNAIERNQIIKQFCQRRINKPCLAGIQYDIEPYLLSDYDQNKDLIWQQWAQAIKKLSESWGGKIEIVVPFWLKDINQSKQIIQFIEPYSLKYIIMVYRTDYELIYDISAKWLSWGDENLHKIVIALENGILSEEFEKYYSYDQTNSEIEEGSNDENSNVNSTDHIVDFTEISFEGNEDELFGMINALTEVFSNWSSFDGFAINGLDVEED
ncbi:MULTISPECIES: hypothetical protein [unclassified Gilliamella]|uniref:hypothetical protein n=1 Tax=unclassified Gilliamella TaxID=2685620 RepID=UPI00226A215A|nr:MULTISPECIES: hypothetical protein [unclassified Gilliamella]MCX8575255.1 hypothetical protein [Gilliamella sp. B3831]MCX8577234.1 hypothetical protein [Gilliamella sp. B3815]MCX8590159.1 hypothetical protein [Gilliamella sp. B3812]MCX8604588.1 hypothetical protein [Gilliamella sp. B3823]MCX8604933.1 hypothetical protein [Gilliamella sp. B3825]